MPVEIIPFTEELKQHFYILNIEWLKSYFYVETFDEEVLSNPEKYIIAKGGNIFFAKMDETIVGTVALMPTSEKNVLELTKMAVSPEYRGFSIGQALMKKCIDFSMENNIEKLILYSNKILQNAIHIYSKYGFTEIPVEQNSPYKRSNIKMEHVLDKN